MICLPELTNGTPGARLPRAPRLVRSDAYNIGALQDSVNTYQAREAELKQKAETARDEAERTAARKEPKRIGDARAVHQEAQSALLAWASCRREFRGIVRAEVWVLAAKAETRRNQGPMDNHWLILGQTPSSTPDRRRSGR
jgi:hypothetical protein